MLSCLVALTSSESPAQEPRNSRPPPREAIADAGGPMLAFDSCTEHRQSQLHHAARICHACPVNPAIEGLE